MIGLFAGAALRWVSTSVVGQVVAAVMVGAIALGLWTWRVSAKAEAAAIAAMMARIEKETREESARRLRELDVARKNLERRDDALAAEQRTRSELLGKIDELSKSNDGRFSIDPAASLRLDSLRGRPPRDRAPKRTRAPDAAGRGAVP